MIIDDFNLPIDNFTRAAPSTGIGISIRPIPAFLVVSEPIKHVIQVPNTTNSVVGTLYYVLLQDTAENWHYLLVFPV